MLSIQHSPGSNASLYWDPANPVRLPSEPLVSNYCNVLSHAFCDHTLVVYVLCMQFTYCLQISCCLLDWLAYMCKRYTYKLLMCLFIYLLQMVRRASWSLILTLPCRCWRFASLAWTPGRTGLWCFSNHGDGGGVIERRKQEVEWLNRTEQG